MTERKDIFIKKTNFELSIIKDFKNAWEIVANVAKSYDNKVLNKRFITKVQDELRYSGFKDVHIAFPTNWRGERENRLTLQVYNNYSIEAGCYIDRARLGDTLYFDTDYIDANNFRLNFNIFKLAIENNSKALDNKINDLTNCIEKVDEVIEKYASMRKYVETTLNSIPQRLREHISVPMPIYDV